MADALLSPVLDLLVTTIKDLVEHDVNLVMGADNAVENLEKNLRAIKAVLKDAEKRQWKDNDDDGVKLWMDDLKDVSYDMDDILVEWRTAILESGKRIADDDHDETDSFAWKIKVRLSVLCRCFSSSRYGPVHHRLDIARKIEDLNRMLDDIVIRKDSFNFYKTRVDHEPRRSNFTTSDLDVRIVYGQEKHKETVLAHLLGQSSQEERDLYIIPIVGMMGSGKTTLAKQIYNDRHVIDHFGVMRAWVCVSDPFDLFEIAKAIVQQLSTDVESTGLGHQVLINKFLSSINDKRILLVLDDVWCDDYQDWRGLEAWLRSSAAGSRIMVTTRKIEVARMIGESHIVLVEKLTEKDCRLLFKEIALFGKKEEEAKDLEQIGDQIADKCKGLPLAVKTLGSLLRCKSKEEWEDVLYSDLWELEHVKLEKVEKHLLSSMFLSYLDLPPREKRCLSYCAIFPKAYLINVEDLIRQWIAQGYFIGNNNEEAEGLKCFKILAMRSFFQDFEYDLAGSIWRCKMHDVVHAFARYLTLNEFSTIEITDARNVDVGNSRHLSLILPPMNGEIPISICRRKNLHTLFVKGPDVCNIGSDLLVNLRFLRTLNLSRCHIKKLPDNIDELILLRYLNLSYNDLRDLPAEMGDLRNLQTLILDFCGIEVSLDDTRGLPQEIGKLRQLRVFSGAYISTSMDKFRLGGFRNLDLLSDLVVENLGAKKESAGSLKLISDKRNLYRVQLNFNMTEENSDIHKDVLEAFKLNVKVEDLRIRDYLGQTFPGWMIKLKNLKRLHLINCKNCISLPPLGILKSLETLELSDMEHLKDVGAGLLGLNLLHNDFTSFPNLKRLRFAFLLSWSLWVYIPEKKVDSVIRIMPRLEYLEFDMCTDLSILPDFLKTTPLEHLIIKRSPLLEKGCREEKESVWTKIQHARNISLLR